MTPRKWIVISILVILIILVVTLLTLPPTEPRYEGNTVTEWAAALSLTEDTNALDSLVQMGEPAISHLTWMLQHEDSQLKIKLLTLRKRFPFLEGFVSSSHWSRYLAAHTLARLGPAATNAIPALEKMKQDVEPSLSYAAEAALVCIRNEAIQPYIDRYQELGSTNSYRAFSVLRELGPAAKAVVPIAIEQLQSTNTRVVARAILLLSAAGKESPECVSPLAKLLDETNTLHTLTVIDALSGLGQMAKPALSSVLPFIESDDNSLRIAALSFVYQIVPSEEFGPIQWKIEQATNDSDELASNLAVMILDEKAKHR